MAGMVVDLTDSDRAMLAGAAGEGTALAMRLIVATAETVGASHLIDIVSAHIDGCLYHGQSGVDFVTRLAEGGAEVRVPTTLNVTSLDLLHPDLVRLDRDTAHSARSLIDGYVALGAQPTWTCAPYQAATQRPDAGAQIAWAESNAIVFANSVLGARTERYGDFIDACAAVTGRVPAFGLHLDAPRLASFALDVSELGEVRTWEYPLIGYHLGRIAGDRVGAVVGLGPGASEDDLKALGAAAASSGSVAMFHAVGATPEAPDLETATGGRPVDRFRITRADIDEARHALSTDPAGTVDAVSLGAPHYSVDEMHRLTDILADRRCRLPTYVNTSREVLGRLDPAMVAGLERSGVYIVTDTCTYITPILADGVRTVMTDSAKWAYYAPANLGVGVVFASLEECLTTATEVPS